MTQLVPCRCPCHTEPRRDIHVSELTGAVLWCCHAPFAQPAPMVRPTPMFEVTLIEVKPMEMPDIRCPNCKEPVFWSPEHMNNTYGSNKPLWRCKERNDDQG